MNVLSVDQNESICRLVVAAGQQARRANADSFQIYEKGFHDYVTDVDRSLDRQLADGLSQLFPEDGVITEENAGTRRQFKQSWQRLWLIDPIDGTEEFINGGDGYAVMVGLLDRYQPAAGWVYAPARETLYWGGPGWGLFCARRQERPQQLRSRCPQPPTDYACPILLGHRDQRRFGDAIASYLPMMQCYSLGSFGLKVLEVVEGKAGVYLYLNGRVKLWDTAGPVALARAAGLMCCDLEGRPFEFSPAMVESETLVHQQAILVGWPSYIEPLLPKLRQAVTEASKQA
ncbi:MAG: inositol monophosphatase family protein [Leptolyngbya sp. SIO4C1]|nr:inositol monophosphatase family protein [Leptolyngbya sp. SIO4C1]